MLPDFSDRKRTGISKYRVTALSANILYLDSLGTEGVNLRGCMFYMKMLHFFRSFRIFSILNINDAMPGRVETRQRQMAADGADFDRIEGEHFYSLY